MKNNEKKNIVFLVIIVVAVIVSSFASIGVYRYFDNKDEEKQEAQKKEQQSVASELQALLEEKEISIEEIDKAFEEKLPLLDKTTATGFIDSLAYLTYYNISLVGELTEAEILLVYEALDAEGTYDESLMVDDSLKQKLGALIESHARIGEVNGNINISVDYGYFVNTYGEYMEDDYKAIFKFYDKEQKESYIDVEKEELMCDVLVDRIEELCSLCVIYKDSGLLDVFKSTKDFYMKEYLGVYSPGKVFEGEDLLKEYVMESYKKVSEDKESPIKEDIDKVLEVYAQTENKKTPEVESLLFDITNMTNQEITNQEASE